MSISMIAADHEEVLVGEMIQKYHRCAAECCAIEGALPKLLRAVMIRKFAAAGFYIGDWVSLLTTDDDTPVGVFEGFDVRIYHGWGTRISLRIQLRRPAKKKGKMLKSLSEWELDSTGVPKWVREPQSYEIPGWVRKAKADAS